MLAACNFPGSGICLTMTNFHRNAAWLLFVVVAGGYWTLARFFPVAYVSMTYEDLYGEWLQMWLFVAVFIVAALLVRRPGSYRWFFILLSLAGLYTFLEEISYGQRLFGVQSPEFFEEYNIQGETNLHNFLTGPESTVLKDVIEYGLALALIAYGFLFPVGLKHGFAPARQLNGIGVAPPPLYLAPFFLIAALLEVGWFNFNEAEVAEVLVGTAMTGMLLHYWYAAGKQEDSGLPGQPGPAATRQGSVFLLLFAVLSGLAWGTTEWFNSDPAVRERTDARLINGYKKYARRLEYKGRWAHAAEFYRLAHEGLFGETEYLQLAVRNYKAAGDEENYRRFYLQLLNEQVARQAGTTGVDDHLAFAVSYGEMGMLEKQHHHLERARFFATERVKRFPKNAENHYWLGRALQQSGDFPAAIAAYETALQLNPESNKFANAIMLLKKNAAASMHQ